MTTLNKIKRAFNKSKTSYDLHAGLQTHVGERLIELMLAVFHKKKLPRIIDLGCGTGTVTQQLLDKIPFSEFHATDIAEDLLKIAKSKLQGKNVHVYARSFDQPPAKDLTFDIAFSNMALHWSDHLENTLQALHAQLSKHGILVFSIPLPGTLRELKPHFRINDFTDAKHILHHLHHLGFDVLAQQAEKVSLTFKDTLSALRSIKHVGANAVKSKKQNHLCGKSLINNIHIQQLTYKIGYFIVRKTEHPCQSTYTLQAQTQTLEKPSLVLEY